MILRNQGLQKTMKAYVLSFVIKVAAKVLCYKMVYTLSNFVYKLLRYMDFKKNVKNGVHCVT